MQQVHHTNASRYASQTAETVTVSGRDFVPWDYCPASVATPLSTVTFSTSTAELDLAELTLLGIRDCEIPAHPQGQPYQRISDAAFERIGRYMREDFPEPLTVRAARGGRAIGRLFREAAEALLIEFEYVVERAGTPYLLAERPALYYTLVRDLFEISFVSRPAGQLFGRAFDSTFLPGTLTVDEKSGRVSGALACGEDLTYSVQESARKEALKAAARTLLDRPFLRPLLGALMNWYSARSGDADVRYRWSGQQWIYTDATGSFADPELRRIHSVESELSRMAEFYFHTYRPRRGDTVVNVGAGNGIDVLLASRLVGPTGTVLAFEAHPQTFAALRKTCELNGLSNVRCFNLAAGAENGTVCIDNGERWVKSRVVQDGEGAAVRAVRLDRFLRSREFLNGGQPIKRIDYLQMNIEGAERQALPGLVGLMRSVANVCICAHDHRAVDGPEMCTEGFVREFLSRYGFQVTNRKFDPRSYVRGHIFGHRVP